jgi:hypothetical protein
MMSFTQDKTVPYENQEKLRLFWNPMYSKDLDANHYWGIVRTGLFHVDSMIDFFDNAFNKNSTKIGKANDRIF